VLAVVAADGCLYHGGGYAGWAVFVAVLVAVLCAGSGRCWQTGRRVIVGLLLTGLVLTVLRLSWQGNLPLIVAAVIQLFALAIALRGGVPFLPRVAQDVALALPRGCLLAPWLVRGNRGALRLFAWVSPVRVWLPALVTVSFAALFVLANPHWTERIAEVFRSSGDWAIFGGPGGAVVGGGRGRTGAAGQVGGRRQAKLVGAGASGGARRGEPLV
jgi:hypothetical protein